MTPDMLEERLLGFAVRVMSVVEALPRTKTATHCGTQMLRCGTSAGANYAEACGAESRNDFVHKCQVVFKELRETRYWLKLVAAKPLLGPRRVSLLVAEAHELVLILSKSVATAKSKRDR